MQLTKEAKDVLQKTDPGMRIRNRLAYELNKSSETIERWIRTNDERMTMTAIVNILVEETGLNVEQLLENKNAA